MKLRTFRGKTMAEALEQVKRRFGCDAVILSTRTERGGVLGIGGGSYVEITAARDDSDLPPPLRKGNLVRRSARTPRAEGAAVNPPAKDRERTNRSHDAILTEIGVLRSTVRDLVLEARSTRFAHLPGTLYQTYQTLVQNAVSDEIAQSLVERVRRDAGEDGLADPAVVREHLARAVEAMVPTAGPIKILSKRSPTIISLVGPTGVGKTTTIAKLAADLSIRQRRRVGLITLDTYRIAAVEQLRTYADIINVPLEIVTTPSDLSGAVQRMADREVILIDTAGRSQRDAVRIKDLQTFFDEVRPDEVHLVLSGTAGREVLLETVRRFRPVGIDRVIFTKLDEAVGFGVMLSCLKSAEAQLSYVTTGQDVPDDIHVGEGKALAKLILAERRRDVAKVG